MKIFLIFLIIGELFVMIGKAISHLFQSKAKSKTSTSVSDGWYRICEKAEEKMAFTTLKVRNTVLCATPDLPRKKFRAKKDDKNES